MNFEKNYDSSTMSLTVSKSCASMIFVVHSTVLNVVFDHVDFAHDDSVPEFLQLIYKRHVYDTTSCLLTLIIML